jgi:hypothetical protein
MRLTRINADNRQILIRQLIVEPIRHATGFQDNGIELVREK